MFVAGSDDRGWSPVRASAGSGSFHREKSLAEAWELAKQHVEKLKQQHEDDLAGDDRRSRAAQQRAADEQAERIEHARAELKTLAEQREQRSGTPTSDPRTSTTDPEARRMKMGDGGYRPAYNVQFSSDCATRVVVATDVGLLPALHNDVVENYGTTPPAAAPKNPPP